MRLYNSQSRKIEIFKSRESKKVTMYVCGITPYDTTHLGHAFTYICFDALFRYLEYKGYKVTYVQNVTDIDDDILKRAKETNRDWKELGEYWTKKFLNDLKSLNVQMPTHYVKATDSIPKMIEIIQVLQDRGFAYENQGNVYFSVDKDKEYGKLSRFTKEQMLLIAKERGNDPSDHRKRNPLDFVLWQSVSVRTQKDEPFWNSPWGKGRPGWHIECSAMVYQYLGEQIDIHGGGRDLIFPHHESEIAQSENYTGKKPFVSLWMHTAMVMYEGEKMSKSLGNLVMVSDLLKKYDANAIRWYLLSHHYRDVWEHRDDEFEKCAARSSLVMALLKSPNPPNLPYISTCDVFEHVMDSDLNTPLALEYIYKLALRIRNEKDAKQKRLKKERLTTCLTVLGFAL
ncbi:MAG: cysteine--tRNA ligase [Candidatus Levybacteria bacterium]|nr:cysteine--tRNA ligase [Candidatus Levybacteria bacterium]